MSLIEDVLGVQVPEAVVLDQGAEHLSLRRRQVLRVELGQRVLDPQPGAVFVSVDGPVQELPDGAVGVGVEGVREEAVEGRGPQVDRGLPVEEAVIQLLEF